MFPTTAGGTDLVEQVKWAQRASPAWKEAWQQYCDQAHNGVRDPSKHSPSSLQQFLMMIGAGAQLTPPATTPNQTPVLQPANFPNLQQSQIAQLAQTLAYAQAPLGVPFPGASPALVPQGWPAQAVQAPVQAGGVPDMAAFAAMMSSMGGLPFWPGGVGMMTGFDQGGRAEAIPQQVNNGACMGVPGAPAGIMQGGIGGAASGAQAGGGRKGGGGGAPASSSPAPNRLVDQVKHLQRTSKALKAQWHQACDAEKGGVKDPSRHDIAFLQQFLNSPQVTAALATLQPETAGGGGFGGKGNSLPGLQELSDPMHVALVHQVKKAQRSGLKEIWWQHCDAEAGGVRDPARHPVTSLRRFLESVELPEGGEDLTPMQTFSGAGRGRGRGRGDFVPGGRKGGGKGKGGKGGNPSPDIQLVEQVKAVQRLSPEWKAAWRRYCDESARSVYDPARHDNTFLQGFLEQSGINGQIQGQQMMMAYPQHGFLA